MLFWTINSYNIIILSFLNTKADIISNKSRDINWYQNKFAGYD